MKSYFNKQSIDLKPTARNRWSGLRMLSLFAAVFLVINFILVGAAPALAETNSRDNNFIFQINQPNIIIDKSVSPASAGIGEQFTFVIAASNQGDGPAENVTFLDVLPPFLTIVSVTSSDNGDVLIVPLDQVNASPVERRIEMSLVPIAAGASRTITIVARVNQNATASGEYANTAFLNFNSTLQVSDTIFYQILVDVIPPTDTPTVTPTPADPSIILEKSVTPSSAGIGGSFTFVIKITNQGIGPASNVSFLDVFPPLLTITSVTSSDNEDKLVVPLEQVNASTIERRIEMSLVPIPAGSGRKITIEARVNQNTIYSGAFANTAFLNFNNTQRASNTVSYQILTNIVLPPTGGMEIDQSGMSGYLPLLIIGLVVGGFGGLALFYARRVKTQEPQLAGRFVVASLALIVAGLVISLAACTVGPQASVPQPEVQEARQQVPAELAGPASSAASQPEAAQPQRPQATAPVVTEEIIEPTPPPEAKALGGNADLSPVKRLVIPALGVDARVRFIPFDGNTWRVDTLESEIAWLGETGWPGLGGNIGLAGHVSLNDGSDGPFRNLSRLKSGDLVKVYTTQNVYTFRVSRQDKVSGGDISVVSQSEGSRLTLITCADWDKTLQTYLSRVVVSSELVDVQPADSRTSSN